jgi:hypothetical protein
MAKALCSAAPASIEDRAPLRKQVLAIATGWNHLIAALDGS